MNDNQGIMPATHESDGHMNQRIFRETSKGCLGQSVEADHHVKLAEVLEEENGVLDSSVVESIVIAREKFQSQVSVKKRDKQKQWGSFLLRGKEEGKTKGFLSCRKLWS
jgi:hypothetical protein